MYTPRYYIMLPVSVKRCNFWEEEGVKKRDNLNSYEKPNFKILLFDDVMFVSSFAMNIRHNDQNAKMFQIKQVGNPLFAGFERVFDSLWEHSASL